MRFNKTAKALAVALPLFAITACSSTKDDTTQTEVNRQAEIAAEKAAQEEAVRVAAAKREAEFKEQQRKAQDALRAKNIVYFDFDQSSVSSEFSEILDAHAKYLNANTSANVLVEGHADERGTPEYNIALGERRAKAVVSYLEAMGVSSSQISVVSYGEEKPMIKDRSEEAFAKNRRAVLVY